MESTGHSAWPTALENLKRKEERKKLLFRQYYFPYFKGEDTKVVEVRLSAQGHPSNSEAMTQTQVLRSKVQV